MNPLNPASAGQPRPMKTIKWIGLGTGAIILSAGGLTCTPTQETYTQTTSTPITSTEAGDRPTAGEPPAPRLHWF